MILARCALWAVAAGAGLLAACSSGDVCAGAATCIQLEVDSLGVHAIDQLELDVVYAGVHATTTTGTSGEQVELPLALPIVINLPNVPVIDIDVIAAGRLRRSVIGVDAASTHVQQGYHEMLRVFLFPVSPCTEGALYCGGTSGVLADITSLYRCIEGVPIFYARCGRGCTSYLTDQGECVGGGLCRDGGTYCGGHVLDGDPGVLYVCSDFDGTAPQPCPRGCLVRGDGDDACG